MEELETSPEGGRPEPEAGAGEAQPRTVSMEEFLAGAPIEASEQPAVSFEDTQLRAVLEAIVYVAEEPLTVAQIASALEQPQERVGALLAQLVAEFDQPAAAVVKHATPCGVAVGPTIGAALERAIATDPVARYGCAIALNRPIGTAGTGALKGVFVDLLAAPEFDPDALEALGHRQKIKLIRLDPAVVAESRWEAKSALGRLLLQEADRRELASSDLKRVTGSPGGPEEIASLGFAWRVVRHAKSNAIVLATGTSTVGIGSGQPTRVKAVELACEVAGARGRGSVLASDAFFPFPDGVEAAGRAGVRAIVQPGGSVRDAEVIGVAERYGIAMYFTGWRVFRH